jgi:hypothetical protein
MNEAWNFWVDSKWISEGAVGIGSVAHFVGKTGQGDWDMEVTEFVKNKKMTMRTIGASKVNATNSVTLEAIARGTTVTYFDDYKLPYSVLGSIIDKLKVSKQMDKDNIKMLENIKRILEAHS